MSVKTLSLEEARLSYLWQWSTEGARCDAPCAKRPKLNAFSLLTQSKSLEFLERNFLWTAIPTCIRLEHHCRSPATLLHQILSGGLSTPVTISLFAPGSDHVQFSESIFAPQ